MMPANTILCRIAFHNCVSSLQKEMFASKVDGGGGGVGSGGVPVGGGGVGNVGGVSGNGPMGGNSINHDRERKLSSSSSSSGMKNKWVKAFKSIKVGTKDPIEEQR